MRIKTLLWSMFVVSVYAPSRVDSWRKALDRAKTADELRTLRKKINKKMRKLSGEDGETAQLFLEVIDRKLTPRPYEEDFKYSAGS